MVWCHANLGSTTLNMAEETRRRVSLRDSREKGKVARRGSLGRPKSKVGQLGYKVDWLEPSANPDDMVIRVWIYNRWQCKLPSGTLSRFNGSFKVCIALKRVVVSEWL